MENGLTLKLASKVIAVYPKNALEVVQENRFSMDNITELIEQGNSENVAYVMTPAGIFPEVTLPIDDISLNDTINSAQLVISRKNNLNVSKYQMGAPNELLMVRKSELNTFFEEQQIHPAAIRVGRHQKNHLDPASFDWCVQPSFDDSGDRRAGFWCV